MRKMLIAILVMMLVALAITAVLTIPQITGNRPEKIANVPGASDFYQRHPEWTWTASEKQPSVSVMGETSFPDYHQRHLPVRTIDTTDYYFRNQ